jgi:lysophospholipid acyltransferase (LPLAT)-like uncharacterized protein
MLIPDGPHGPAYSAKLGVVVLAQMTGAPLLPISFAVDRRWRLGSWDRLIIPKPFARVRMAVGEPITVQRASSSNDLEGYRQRLEESLNELGEHLLAGRAGTEGSAPAKRAD